MSLIFVVSSFISGFFSPLASYVFLYLCLLSGAAGITSEGTDTLLVHPNFRMIVLANRPGFPFLGNDFFASLGEW